MMLALPRIKSDAVETSVKSSSVLDKAPAIAILPVLDTVTGSNVMLALAVKLSAAAVPVTVGDANFAFKFRLVVKLAMVTYTLKSGALDNEL